MAPSAAHQNPLETSEVVFGIPLLLSIILGFTWPLPIFYGILRWAFMPVAIVLVCAGIGLIVAARRELARYGQPTDPGRPTGILVKSSVFSISRNPLYLGIVVLIAGLAFGLNNWWMFILLVPEVILCHVILIFPEERYLMEIFGDEYTMYMHSVYRWFGRK